MRVVKNEKMNDASGSQASWKPRTLYEVKDL
jgi:hypothetical protein